MPQRPPTSLAAVTFALLLGCAPDRGPSDEAPPRPSPSAAEPVRAGAQEVVQVPYRRVKDQMLVSIRIRGQGPFTFLVDTGVTGAAIDLGLASGLGIELSEENAGFIRPIGASDSTKIYQTHITDLRVGSLGLDSLQAAAIPLTAFGDRLGEPLHGILGSGFLRSRVTRFDYVNRTMTFAPTAGAFADEIAAADYTLPMEIHDGDSMPIVDVTLGGTTFRATLDTGSSLGLEIFTPYAEELGLGDAFSTWEQSQVLGGSLGHAVSYDGSVDAIEIGPLRFTDVPTHITPPRFDSYRKGNLGNQLWLDYVLILDFVGERVIFRRVS